MKFILSIALLLNVVYGSCQVTIERQVVNSGNINYGSSNLVYSSTVGESIISTEAAKTFDLTQGFHQPGTSFIPLSFEVVAEESTCPTSADGSAQIVNLLGCNEPYSILWSTGDTGLVVMNLSPGLYNVNVSTQGCNETVEFEVLSGPNEYCGLVFFNAFSPNGDGVNDVWEILNISDPEYRNNDVEIFNRWGQTIWQGSRYDNNDVVWRGKSSTGVELSSGTYYYLAQINGVEFKGYIELTK